MEKIDRTFDTVDKNGQLVKLKIKESNYHIDKMCDIEFKKAWCFSIENGVKVRQKIEETLRDNSIWTDKEEQKLKSLEMEAAIYLNLLNKKIEEKDFDQAKEAALSAANARNKINSLLMLKQTAFSYSAEGLASEVKIEAYVAYATVYANDESKSYWKDYGDFIKNREEKAAIDAISLYTKLLIEENLNILKTFPENKFLIDNGYMTEEFRIPVDKTPKQASRTKKKVK